MDKPNCCAILGHSPMRFAWGFDEDDEGCKRLKLELLRQITDMRKQGVTQYMVACDFGVGLYAAEAINIIRELDAQMQLYCVVPYEEQATKWAPYLRERYFEMLEKCTYISTAGTRKTPTSQLDAYLSIVEQSDVVLSVYDPASARGDEVDMAMKYASRLGKPIVMINPDSFECAFIERTNGQSASYYE